MLEVTFHGPSNTTHQARNYSNPSTCRCVHELRTDKIIEDSLRDALSKGDTATI